MQENKASWKNLEACETNHIVVDWFFYDILIGEKVADQKAGSHASFQLFNSISKKE